MKNYLIYLILFIALIGCNGSTDEKQINNLSKLDNMFNNGFQMELEQVYIMDGSNTIPYLDTPKDSAFKNEVSKLNIVNFISYNTNKDTIMNLIMKYEKWNISKMTNIKDTIRVEHGYGSTYLVTETIVNKTFNVINCTNQYTNRNFYIKIKIGDSYNYRGNDNHLFMIQNIKENTIYNSNLYFEILTKGGNGLFSNDKYIYLDTNPIITLFRQMTPPLTGDKVKEEIANGNYTLYLYNGLTTYKIGDNLYIPRYNSYVYVGTVNTNGMVINLESKYYRFKFRII